jgi:protein-S-isoprenylcysteine O-methyltransferase Ste14
MEIYLRYFYTGLILLGAIYGYFLLQKSKNVRTDGFSVLEGFILLGLVIFGLLIPHGVFWLYPEFNVEFPEFAGQISIGFMILAVLLLLRTFKDLGKQYSPTLQIFEYHGLITSGIYKYVRHPMYLTALLLLIAQSLSLPNRIGLGSNAIAFGLLLFLRIPAEEKMLIKEFDMEYKKYMERTAKLVPFVY